MSDDERPAREPAENIARGDPATFDAADPETRAAAVVARLGELYWQTTYGGRDAFECLVRTVLSQNTADQASQPAHDALVDRYGPVADLAANLAAADREALAGTIQPAGLHNRKATTLQGLAERVVAEHGDAAAFDAFVREGDPDAVRAALLALDGVGPKTADCVLLFAGGRDGVFPVDTHVHRLYRRLGVAAPDADHEAVRATLAAQVPAERCGFGHTASIQFGREHCTARSPACLDGPDACPLADLCDRVGVDPATGTVLDPAEAGD